MEGEGSSLALSFRRKSLILCIDRLPFEKRVFQTMSLMILGFDALAFLVLLLLGKTLTVLELRALERDYRQHQGRIADLEEALDTSRRKYLIALKAEGVSKHRASQLKTRLASVRQHLEQLEKTAAQQEARRAQELKQKLEGLVMRALGGATVRRDSQFKRVMKVIHQLVDLHDEENSEELIAAIQKKIEEMGREGLLKAAEQGALSVADEAPEPDGGDVEADEAPAPEPDDEAAQPASEPEPEEQAQSEPEPEPQEEQEQPEAQEARRSRRDLVREAIVKKSLR